jgi:type II secretory pathway pseudopilin PulG
MKRGARGKGREGWSDDGARDPAVSFTTPLAQRLSPLARQDLAGFTILEIIIVLFLLVGMLTMVLPRMVGGEDLAATGRKFIGALRSLQSMASTVQKPVKLYLDLDQGSYWAVIVEGKEEKPPLDAVWSTRQSLPESIRFTDVSVGPITRRSGQIELSLYPNGRIDPGLFHLADGNNSILAIAIEPVTGAIKTGDARIEPTRKPPIPDRIKPLMQAAVQVRR